MKTSKFQITYAKGQVHWDGMVDNVRDDMNRHPEKREFSYSVSSPDSHVVEVECMWNSALTENEHRLEFARNWVRNMLRSQTGNQKRVAGFIEEHG